jgi:hypothetical protein
MAGRLYTELGAVLAVEKNNAGRKDFNTEDTEVPQSSRRRAGT